MTKEKELAVLRAAERLGLKALHYLPYSDEVAEDYRTKVKTDELSVVQDLKLVRLHLQETETAILNIAEHNGRP